MLEPAAGLVVVSATTSQFGAVVAFKAFDRIGPVGAAGGRIGFAALFLVLANGLPRGRTRAEWRPIVPLGIALALMNTLFYLALERLRSARRGHGRVRRPDRGRRDRLAQPRHVAAAVLAASGSALLGEGLGGSSVTGLALAVAAGAAWGAYIVSAAASPSRGAARAG